jgi:hypothetical protein
MADFLVKHPPGYSRERAYILDVMLNEFLGISFESREEPRSDVSISLAHDTDGSELRIAETLFQTRPEDWLRPSSLPVQPLPVWRIPVTLRDSIEVDMENVPVLYPGKKEKPIYVENPDGKTWLGFDIFGSAFFMLARYEEHCADRHDNHGRFSAVQSSSFDAKFHARPIVNDYLEILWACLLRLFPGLVRRERRYRFLLSHDVDRLFETRGVPWRTVLRNSAGDVLKRKAPALAARRVRSRFSSRTGDYRYEPTNTFDFIMDSAQNHNLQSAYYWIVERGNSRFEPDYSINLPFVRDLLRRISARGHEIGLHASYESYDQPERLRWELQRLIDTAEDLDIRQDEWGGRQHYLRWDAGSTWRHWDAAGLAYDSTLAYPERIGFRCGVCFEYPVFDVLERRRLNLRERPLVAMDVSILSDNCMALSPEKALEELESLASICRGFQGDFTLLWHNDSLVHRWQRRLFSLALEVISP